VTTDTGDTDGAVLEEKPWEHISAESLREACQQLTGEQWQVPPIYSAVKFKGQALYKYARHGKSDQVPLESLGRKVHVEALELLAFKGSIGTFRMLCSKGTYVRAIATRLGELASSCGTVSRLVRTMASGIRLAEAVSIEALEVLEEPLSSRLIPIGQMLLPIPKWRVTPFQHHRLRQGQVVSLGFDAYNAAFTPDATPASMTADTFLMIDNHGTAIGIGESRDKNGTVSVSLKRGFL
jgi:tRNA pseudouridine55 synthase